MSWTTEPPKIAGWYWWRYSSGHPPYMSCVKGDEIMYVVGNGCRQSVLSFGGEWYGPLEPPKE